MSFPIGSALSTERMFAMNATDSTDNSETKKAEEGRNPMADKTVFLQLLVSQIKYQNPLEPADSIQYVTQLNQFSATEQLVEIRKLLETNGTSEEPTGGQF
jgi:flagellar basal-body rod modification protein FlgD